MARLTGRCVTCGERVTLANREGKLRQHWKPEGGICPSLGAEKDSIRYVTD